MPIYKVVHIQKQEYIIHVKASDKTMARTLAAMCFHEYPASDSYWYDSEVTDQWDDEDCDAPEPDIEEE